MQAALSTAIVSSCGPCLAVSALADNTTKMQQQSKNGYAANRAVKLYIGQGCFVGCAGDPISFSHTGGCPSCFPNQGMGFSNERFFRPSTFFTPSNRQGGVATWLAAFNHIPTRAVPGLSFAIVFV